MKTITKILKLEQKLEINKNTKIEDMDVSKIKNVKRINIDSNKSAEKRILDFIATVENPYIIKVNDMFVKMEFSNSNIQAKECINKLFLNLYQ